MNLFSKSPKLHWKTIASKGGPKKNLYRSAVPGGWLVCTHEGNSIAFVPDPEHRWNGDSLPFFDD